MRWSLPERRFGVEFEVGSEKSQEFIVDLIGQHTDRGIRQTGHATSYNNIYWHIKQDATCGKRHKDAGWEVASFVGENFRDLEEIARIAEVMKYFGVKTNYNCGFHVHVAVPDFDREKMGVLIARFLKCEDQFLAAVPGYRIDNPFARSLTFRRKTGLRRKHTPLSLWHHMCPSRLTSANNWERRVTMNLVNFTQAIIQENLSNPRPYRKTVEFRFPEGTLDFMDVMNWVRWFVIFVDNSKDHRMPANLSPVTGDDFFEMSGLTRGAGLTRWYLERYERFKHDRN